MADNEPTFFLPRLVDYDRSPLQRQTKVIRTETQRSARREVQVRMFERYGRLTVSGTDADVQDQTELGEQDTEDVAARTARNTLYCGPK